MRPRFQVDGIVLTAQQQDTLIHMPTNGQPFNSSRPQAKETMLSLKRKGFVELWRGRGYVLTERGIEVRGLVIDRLAQERNP